MSEDFIPDRTFVSESLIAYGEDYIERRAVAGTPYFWWHWWAGYALKQAGENLQSVTNLRAFVKRLYLLRQFTEALRQKAPYPSEQYLKYAGMTHAYDMAADMCGSIMETIDTEL